MAFSLGKMPTTLVLRSISPLSCSIGLDRVQLGAMLLREDHVGQHIGLGVVDDDSALLRFRSGLRLKGCREGVWRR